MLIPRRLSVPMPVTLRPPVPDSRPDREKLFAPVVVRPPTPSSMVLPNVRPAVPAEMLPPRALIWLGPNTPIFARLARPPLSSILPLPVLTNDEPSRFQVPLLMRTFRKLR
ncbi:hypothetical protein D3C85_1134900 [compost metagenome]